MNLFDLFNSWLGPSFGILLASFIPYRQAYWFADRIAEWVARAKEAPMVRAVRSNQATVQNLAIDDENLDEIVGQVFRVAARSYVDLYKGISRGAKAIRRVCAFDPQLMERYKYEHKRGNPVLVVGPHMAGFELMLLILKLEGFDIMGLAAIESRSDYRFQNMLRRRFGLDIAAISYQSLRKALRHLKQGGFLLTGIDYPVGPGDTLTFFGRPTKLPIGYARLAMKTGASLVIPLLNTSETPGHYYATASDTLYPEDFGDRWTSPLDIAQSVLSVVEQHIRSRPQEWMMFHPLWPEDLI